MLICIKKRFPVSKIKKQVQAWPVRTAMSLPRPENDAREKVVIAPTPWKCNEAFAAQAFLVISLKQGLIG